VIPPEGVVMLKALGYTILTVFLIGLVFILGAHGVL
jgi:hypothetical protein